MNPRPILSLAVAAIGFMLFATSPGTAGSTFHGATAFHGIGTSQGGLTSPGGTGGGCHHGGGHRIIKFWNFNKNININKNLNVNQNLNVNKNLNINKNIVIAKSNSISVAVSGATSAAAGYSSSGSYAETVTVNHNEGGESVAAEETCEIQEGTVVKAIHALCVSEEGREFPASHMLRETWIDTTYEGEVVRCIAGSTVKVVIGDVVETDQGTAGTYENGEVLACGRGEALWHYKNGMVKCAPAMPVKDCTERTNLRKYGTGDFFFSYRGKVCVNRVARSKSVDLSSTSWNGGVGEGDE
jgi:hypothetical protein